MLGPVVKIDPAVAAAAAEHPLSRAEAYDELPRYIAGWDVALLPFARNEATRFISPTKTPEYLAAGKPVVSTSIRDVVRPYGEQGLVRIADDVAGVRRARVRAALGRGRRAARMRARRRVPAPDVVGRHVAAACAASIDGADARAAADEPRGTARDRDQPSRSRTSPRGAHVRLPDRRRRLRRQRARRAAGARRRQDAC